MSKRTRFGLAETNGNRANLADLIAKDIKTVAETIGVPVQFLTYRKYTEAGGKYSVGHLAMIGTFRSIVDTYYPTVKLESTTIRLRDVKTTQREISKAIGTQDIFMEELSNVMEKMPKINIKPYNLRKSKKKVNRALNVVISDLHIGSDIDPQEGGQPYGIKEEARIIAHIVRTVCEYKTKYREETELNLFILGDIIQGELHGPSSADRQAAQDARAMWLLQQMVARFAEHFRSVNVYTAVGNHGRNTAVHHSRAIHQKWNSHETTIYYGVYLATKHIENVHWHQTKMPWVSTNILGHEIYATHGDTNFSIGNPGSNLNVRGIENMMNKINASLKDTKEYKVFIVGHAHTGMVTKMPNNAFLIVNGPGTPPDSFAQTLNIMEAPQNQVMFETTEEYAVGDNRFIDMTGTAKDETLDEIVRPWPGFAA